MTGLKITFDVTPVKMTGKGFLTGQHIKTSHGPIQHKLYSYE